MKKQSIIFLFLLITGIVIFSCSNDEQNIQANQEIQSTDVRSGKQDYIGHSPEETAFIHSIKDRVDAQNDFDFGPDYLNDKGAPDWDLAIIPGKALGEYKSVIVPIIKGDEINAFFFVFDGEELIYDYIDKILIRPPYFVYVGPVNHEYEMVFELYDLIISGTQEEDQSDIDDILDEIAEWGGCYITTSAEVPCSCQNHTMDEVCNCSLVGGTDPFIQYTSASVPCDNEGGGPGTSTGPSTNNGSGGNNGTGNNGSSSRRAIAMRAAKSVCPLIPQEACDRLYYIIDNAGSSVYCMYIPTQVADLLEDPTTANKAAATCFIMTMSVNDFPSAPTTCTTPFNSKLSELAEVYSEMDPNLISWAVAYNGLDDIPCLLTAAGYTAAEKNQILQAYKDYLGTPPPTGSGDILPENNWKLDNVNALNAVLNNLNKPELNSMIPFFLENPQHIPFISEFVTKVDGLVDEYELNENNYYSIIDFNCVFDLDFETCVKYGIADDSDDCDFELIWCTEDTESEAIPNKVSPSSFNFKSTGVNGWTCQVNSVVYKYVFSFGLTKIIHKIGDFCVQVPKTKENGDPLYKVEAQNKMALAWEIAESATQTAYVLSNHSWGQVQYKSAFLLNLEIAMLDFFPGTFGQGALSIQNQACSGNITGRSLKYF